MATASHAATSDGRRTLRGILARGVQVLTVLLAQGVLLFLAAGRLAWAWAWVLLAIWAANIAVVGSLTLKLRAETVAERGLATLTQAWDKAISAAWGIMQYLLLPLVAGFDLRWNRSGEPALGWHIGGALLLSLGLALFSWAMITNAYFSTAVRIQSERGHAVCSSGPYRVVRHPGYVGSILQCLGAPLLLGSWWALIPGLLAALCVVARTALEDRTLQAELPGYKEYAGQVRYRLLPGLW